MAILSREQVEERKQYDCEYVSQIWVDDYIETIEHLHIEQDEIYARADMLQMCHDEELKMMREESARRELAHEKARRAVEVELKHTVELMLNNFEVGSKTVCKQAERIKQLEEALNKASQLLQDNGFEEESKVIDCMAEL